MNAAFFRKYRLALLLIVSAAIRLFLAAFDEFDNNILIARSDHSSVLFQCVNQIYPVCFQD